MLNDIGIATNKNTIPFDPESPFITSGIRIGTAAMTTRGMKEPEMFEIAELISDTLENKSDIEKIKKRVYELCDRFPLYR
jgi:serine hydroxymethyltransferase (EC 2.1.2.1)